METRGVAVMEGKIWFRKIIIKRSCQWGRERRGRRREEGGGFILPSLP
jgi:hypothetical protein